MGMNRAYIFTVDVIIAAAVVTVMLTSSYFILGDLKEVSPNHKYILATDSLATLDQSGDFKETIKEEEATVIQGYLDNAMPEQYCGNITIYDSTNNIILNAVKTGCTEKKPSLSIARRMVMVQGDPYRVKMEAWLN